MPNWCNNRLSIVGPNRDVNRIVAHARGPVQHYKPSKYDKENFKKWEECQKNGTKYEPEERVEVFSFHQLVPIPDDIMEKDYDPHGYHAEHELWGVKWGASDAMLEEYSGEDIATYNFSTPWGPPYKLLETLSKENPMLTFVISFAEECPTRGRLLFKNGKQIDVTGKESHMPKAPDNEDDYDDYFENEYQDWYYEYVNTHDEWVANNVVNERALREILE